MKGRNKGDYWTTPRTEGVGVVRLDVKDDTE